MATTKTLTPTNQAITLAAFTEKPDNRTNVTNDDKLADAVNTLNSNFYASDLGSGTLSDIQTSLETLGSSLNNYQFKNVKFAITAASGYFDDGSYIGTIKRFSSRYYCVDLQGSIPYNFIQGAYRQNIGWTWNNINSKITNVTYDVLNPVGGYFTKRDTFRAKIRCGVAIVESYINFTTEIPANTEFASIGTTGIYGSYIAINTSTRAVYYVSLRSTGRFASETAIPTGYYYFVGCAI